MREKVKFIRITTTQDATGRIVNTESIYYEPKGAEVTEIQPSLDTIVGQDSISMLINVKIRYNPEVFIRIGDKIEWRGFRFNSIVMKVDPWRRFISIKAMSEMETSDRDNPPQILAMSEIPLELL